MDFSAFLDGFGVVTQPGNLLYCLIGVVVGMLIGVLPGLGPAATMAILLPIVYSAHDPVAAIIMLAGIYYGAQYGGTITSVLLRIPGEASSVVTVFDGFALAKQGKAGTALGIAAIGSFIGATVSIIGLTLLGPARGRASRSTSARRSTPRSRCSACCWSPPSATATPSRPSPPPRSACSWPPSAATASPAPTASPSAASTSRTASTSSSSRWACSASARSSTTSRSGTASRTSRPPSPTSGPPARTCKEAGPAIGRGSFIGFVLGVLPGGGAVMASLAAYAAEKRVAKDPSRFGRGAIEGVAGPESANNAAATSSFIPLLTIGIPANASMAMLYAALLVVGVTPGPQLIDERPDLFWGVVNSMYIGNLILLLLSIPLVGIFVRILRVRPAILAPITALITILGVYTIHNSVFDIFLMIVFGVIGYLMKKTGFEPGPMVLAFVLGSLIESSFRRSMLIFDGDATGLRDPPDLGHDPGLLRPGHRVPADQKAFRRKTPATDTTP